MEQAIEAQEQTLESVETPIAEQAETTENAEPSNESVETKPERTFTQAELDDIIKRRVERAESAAAKKAAQEARDALIADENIQWNGRQIKSEAEYREMLKEQEIRKQYEGRVDEDLLQEVVESKKFREEYNEKQKREAAETREKEEFLSFSKAYPDVKGEDIPATVWAEYQSGKSLVDAYAKHENQLLKQKLATLEQQKQIEAQNQENAQSSTGSVTGNGTNVPTFFTKKQVDGMSTSEVNKHYDAIVKSMQNPKFYE